MSGRTVRLEKTATGRIRRVHTERLERSASGKIQRTARYERASLAEAEPSLLGGGPTPADFPFGEVEQVLDRFLADHVLAGSLSQFQAAGRAYPFVDMRELKPGAAGAGVPEQEVTDHRHGLIILVDGTLPPEVKKHVRIKDKNRVVKENLAAVLPIEAVLGGFELGWTHVGRPEVLRLIGTLLHVDYGLLIQHDPRASRMRRFALTHFRVRIDWPIEDAAEALALDLRYVARHLYEHSEHPELRAEQLEAKLFERHGFHHTVGGRRTAAVLAAQYLGRLVSAGAIADFRIYVGSSEGRTLTKIGPARIERRALVRLSREDLEVLPIDGDARATHVLLHDVDRGGVGILQVDYEPTEHAKRGTEPKGGDNLPSLPFLRIAAQWLVPRSDCPEAPRIPCSMVYRNPVDA